MGNITPKEKAEEILRFYLQIMWSYETAKNCAILCIDMMILKSINDKDYYIQVKQELNNLIKTTNYAK